MKRQETKDRLSVTNCRPARYKANASPEMKKYIPYDSYPSDTLDNCTQHSLY
jgi:hypothetical protein